MEKDINKIIDKIKAVLKLADPSRNPEIHEVEAAMRRAQAIALKYGIDLDKISAEEHIDEDVVEVSMTFDTKTVATWVLRIADVVGENHRVKVFKRGNSFHQEVILMGYKRDCDVAEVIIRYAVGTCSALFRRWLDERKKTQDLTRSQSIALRNDYVDGFIMGIRSSYAANVKENGLVPVCPTKVLDVFNGMKMRTIKTSSIRMGDMDAYLSGKKDGEAMGSRKSLKGG